MLLEHKSVGEEPFPFLSIALLKKKKKKEALVFHLKKHLHFLKFILKQLS